LIDPQKHAWGPSIVLRLRVTGYPAVGTSRGVLRAVRIGKRRVPIRRDVLAEFIAAGDTSGMTEVATTEGSETEGREAGSATGLPADGREQLAPALAEPSAALVSDDRERLARAFRALSEAARELAAVLEGTGE
jgi:hypothetical protein